MHPPWPSSPFAPPSCSRKRPRRSTLPSSPSNSKAPCWSRSVHVSLIPDFLTPQTLAPQQIFPTFEPSGTLAVNFTQSVGVVATGQAIAIGDVQAKPEFSINLVKVGRALQYTVLIVDASIAGTTNSSSLYRHYLQA